jgi:hypothetical protein
MDAAAEAGEATSDQLLYRKPPDVGPLSEPIVTVIRRDRRFLPREAPMSATESDWGSVAAVRRPRAGVVRPRPDAQVGQ